MAFDKYKAVKHLEAAGASEELARAVIQVIFETTPTDEVRVNDAKESAKMRLALGDLEVRLTNRLALIALGVMGVSIFSSLTLSVAILSGFLNQLQA